MAQATAPILDSTARIEPVLSGSAYWGQSGQRCCGAVMRAFDPNLTPTTRFCCVAQRGFHCPDDMISLALRFEGT